MLTIQFYIDKYNLMFIYPLEFESQTISRKMLVKNSFFAVILFQLGMISVGSLKTGTLSPKVIVYLVAFVLI